MIDRVSDFWELNSKYFLFVLSIKLEYASSIRANNSCLKNIFENKIKIGMLPKLYFLGVIR